MRMEDVKLSRLEDSNVSNEGSDEEDMTEQEEIMYEELPKKLFIVHQHQWHVANIVDDVGGRWRTHD